MTLAPAQDLSLALLRSRRSQRSWIAGSAVLHPFLPRQPGDIDIHHPDARAARDAVRTDLSALLEHGFAIERSAWQETERWARFRHEAGPVVLNWVVVDEPERARPRRHPDFGYAARIEDVVAEKLATALASGRRKDIEDLQAVARAGVPLLPELGRRLGAFLRSSVSGARIAPGRMRP
ncbi:hypothetical protein KXS07_18325 [Inquilinus limosus]|uniref:hypothetical protein n=1 Tax=Inquilinus limosus TaxID=171674 RepID=UPI003F1804BB